MLGEGIVSMFGFVRFSVWLEFIWFIEGCIFIVFLYVRKQRKEESISVFFCKSVNFIYESFIFILNYIFI